MKVFVVGGAGYIGAHVARALLDAGHEVCVYDNFSSGQKENLFAEAALTVGDILDYSLLKKSMEGFDAVVHLAALKAVGESMIYPEKYSLYNISGSLNILNAMSHNNIHNIVFSSSAAVFGEPQYVPIDEKHPKEPTSYYGFTKLEIERFMAWYDKLKGIKYASLRYFNAAGYDQQGRIGGLEKHPANLLPVIMEAAFGLRPQLTIFGDDYPTPDGTCIRDYVHVGDLARAHVMALEHIARAHESLALNLGSEKGLSVKQIYDGACKIVGKTIPVAIGQRRPGDPAKLIASNAAAQKILGWQAQESDIDTLVNTTYEAYKRHYSS